MNKNKTFLVFLEDVKLDKDAVIYESGITVDWYIDPFRPEYGFEYRTVSHYPLAFFVSTDRDKVIKAVATKKHELKYGKHEKGDVSCPKCGYQYCFDYYDNNDGFYTPAIVDDFTEKVKCICGCEFVAKIEVMVSWNVNLIT